jgi:hypothetical protein
MHVLSALNGFRQVGEQYNSSTSFESSAAADFVEAERVRESLVTMEYFSRPFWPPSEALPAGWQKQFDAWKSFLRRLDTNISKSYLAMYDGLTIPPTIAKHILDEWIEEHSPDLAQPQEPAPEPAPPPPAEGPTRLPDVWMLSDRPIENHFRELDLLHFSDYASALATIVDHEKTETPFTMAINAPWGAGKTTLSNMIAAELEQRPRDRGQWPHIICRFNAWMHDDAANLATAFIAEISRRADRYRPWWRRIVDPLPSAVLDPHARRWREIRRGSLAVVLAMTLSLWLGVRLEQIEDSANKTESHQTSVTKDPAGREITRSETEIQTQTLSQTAPRKGLIDQCIRAVQRFSVLGAFFTALAGLIGLLKLLPSGALGGFVESPEKAADLGAIDAAATQLKRLIAQATWRGNRFVVFVDDIERCSGSRSVDVLDAVKQLMDHKNVVVVLLGDMPAVAAAAQLRYKDLAQIYAPGARADHGGEAFGRLYIEKLIQFQFDLPVLSSDRMQQYMRQLAVPRSVAGGTSGQIQ